MSDIVIQAEALGKRYLIGHQAEQERYTALRDVLVRNARGLWYKTRDLLQGKPVLQGDTLEEFWALRDVSFAIRRGEAVGVIGRNGAGKSTLLKILSRITEPSAGRVTIRGRVASLLEVGTGFHPELTGRENIYLNGAILGMSQAEIKRKFDEIVAFAEVEQFLDTPVKRYSSGMYVRLAFAVAAHLEPEILVVDEVLAVGDAAFQKKCLGKMGDVASEGRTVLFVSHQMNSIRRLCERCIWLDTGAMRMIAPVMSAVSAYESNMLSTRGASERIQSNNSLAQFLRWEIVEPRCEQPNWLMTLQAVTFKIVLNVNRAIERATHGISLRNSDNQLIWAWAAYNFHLEPGSIEFVYTLPSLPLRPGPYYFHVSLYEDATLLDEWNVLPELIIATESLTHPRDEWSGILNMPCQFNIVTT